jgi:hypothetical protein
MNVRKVQQLKNLHNIRKIMLLSETINHAVEVQYGHCGDFEGCGM